MSKVIAVFGAGTGLGVSVARRFGAAELPGGIEITVADPDDLAEHYWDMYTRRDRVEQIHPASLAPQAVAATA
jgi:NAD(P)-dependent dehydrogenase (short-subunit alcohol dehydrogenase family)